MTTDTASVSLDIHSVEDESLEGTIQRIEFLYGVKVHVNTMRGPANAPTVQVEGPRDRVLAALVGFWGYKRTKAEDPHNDSAEDMVESGGFTWWPKGWETTKPSEEEQREFFDGVKARRESVSAG